MSSITTMGGTELDLSNILKSHNKADYMSCTWDSSNFHPDAHGTLWTLNPATYGATSPQGSARSQTKTGQFYFVQVAPRLFVADRLIPRISWNSI